MPSRRQKTKTKPRYDPVTRELWLGDRLVKRYRVQAANQILILRAFQELGRPTHIDDPLPPHPEIDPHDRLHDAVKRLNQHQITPLIHFERDGTGCGILWSLIEPK
jgi:hypothetical protein